MNVLLNAYFCHPNRGSEAAVGWNWLCEIARRNQVRLFFYAGQGQEAAVRDAVAGLAYAANIHLVPIAVPSFFQHRLYRLRYEVWQRAALREARALLQREKIDLIHHVTIAAWWNCGYLWQLGLPFVFGPISGAQRTPRAGYAFLPDRDRLGEWTREIGFEMGWRLWRRPRQALRAAAAVLAANPETETRVRQIRREQPVVCMAECGIRPGSAPAVPNTAPHTGVTRLLWAGRLIPTKNFGLLLRSLAAVPQDMPWRLEVAGDGPQLGHWQERVAAAGLQAQITFLGRIDYARMAEHYQAADIFVFPSLREASGTALLEAMSFGLPAIALDLHGARTLLADGCGILVPVDDSAQMINAFRDAIVTLCRDHALRQTLGKAARQKIAAGYRWEQRGEQMNELYAQVLARSEQKAGAQT